MKQLAFIIKLESEAIFTEHSLTSGTHSTLDTIPGSSILGCVAGMLYSENEELADRILFHESVNFQNAVPLIETEPAIPVPFSWHTEKGDRTPPGGEAAANRKYISSSLPEKMFNGAIENSMEHFIQNGHQPVQVRTGYFTPSGKTIQMKRRYRLKSAIDRNRGGASREAMLFGYESLQKGSLWLLRVDILESAPPETTELIRKSLTSNPLHLGRSRSAEYGRASCFEIEPPPELKAIEGDTLNLHLLSDLSLRDLETGSPALIPKPELLGLDGFDWVRELSFLRTRSYTPFNGKRKRSSLERQLIQRGSVLVYKKVNGEKVTAQDLLSIQSRFSKGIGEYRSEGLGQVAINPPYLSGEKFHKEEPISITIPESLNRTPEKSRDDSPITRWLKKEKLTALLTKQSEKLSTVWLRDLKKSFRTTDGSLPASSQWGRVRQETINATNFEDLQSRLFSGEKSVTSHGVSKSSWDSEFALKRETDVRWISFRDYLKDCIGQCDKNMDLIRKSILRFTGEIQKELNRGGGI